MTASPKPHDPTRTVTGPSRGRRHARQPVNLRPGGIAADEEFARDEPPVVVGEMLVAIYATTVGREWVLDCRHATTSGHRQRDDPGASDGDAEVLAGLVYQHQRSHNEGALLSQQGASELCGCEPRRIM